MIDVNRPVAVPHSERRTTAARSGFLAAVALLLLTGSPVAAAGTDTSPSEAVPVRTAPSQNAPSSAADSAPAPAAEDVTWAVDPATAEGPDGRAWVELVLDPGQEVTDHLAVRNLGKEEITFALTAADGYFTDKGRFSMLTSDRESVAAGTWVSVRDSVTVGPGDTAVVPFSVTVPSNATPGDHAAGIAASVSSVGNGGTMAVESRVGFRVMTRVTGDIVPGLTMQTLDAGYDMTWNPVAPGVVEVDVVLANTGNVALSVDAVATAGGASAAVVVQDGAPTIELLPGDERVATARISDVWPMGPLGTELTARAVQQGSGEVVPAVTAAVTVWAVPWSQLLVLAGLVLLVLALRSGRRRRARHLQDLLDRARDEGRAQAADGVGTTASGVRSRS